MKNIRLGIIVFFILLILVLIAGPFYVVEEGEIAIITRFGKIIHTEPNAGLHEKMPIIDKVSTYTKKIQRWDGEAQRFPTEENQMIWVDFTARWRIANAKLFYESLGSILQAHSRLDDVINATAREIIAKNPLREAVRNSNLINKIERKDVYSSHTGSNEDGETTTKISTFTKMTYEEIATGREKLSRFMLAKARQITPQYGIELIDIVIRQIKYSDDITHNVFNQMIKERNQIAQAFRSDGEGEKAKWLGKMEKELLSIRSDAERQAKEKKATADGEALEIRNKAYGQDPEFAEFWMALVEYQKLLPKMKKILTTEFDFFKYLHNKGGAK